MYSRNGGNPSRICIPAVATSRGDTRSIGSNKEELVHIIKDLQSGGHNRKGFYPYSDDKYTTPLDTSTKTI